MAADSEISICPLIQRRPCLQQTWRLCPLHHPYIHTPLRHLSSCLHLYFLCFLSWPEEEGGRQRRGWVKEQQDFIVLFGWVTSCTLSLAHGAVPRDTFLDVLAVFTSSKYCVNVFRWMHLSSSCLFAYLPSALKGQDGKPSFGAFFFLPVPGLYCIWIKTYIFSLQWSQGSRMLHGVDWFPTRFFYPT